MRLVGLGFTRKVVRSNSGPVCHRTSLMGAYTKVNRRGSQPLPVVMSVGFPLDSPGFPLDYTGTQAVGCPFQARFEAANQPRLLGLSPALNYSSTSLWR